jgi:branched-subunit amino acid aminotransferase/4-amino-4-deoxychorismate lyase
MLPWDLVQVHILPHALHYEPVCFEGLRAYEAGGNARHLLWFSALQAPRLSNPGNTAWNSRRQASTNGVG